MSEAVTKLNEAQKFAMSIRPKVGGFPVLAEALSEAGIQMNRWSLPSCQSIYLTKLGPVVQQGAPLVTGTHDIAPFNKKDLIAAIRTDQEGKSTFPEFLQAAWRAGVVSYDANFVKRHVIYYGANGESYLEEYKAVDLKDFKT